MSKGPIQKPQQKSDLDKQDAKQKAKVNEVPLPQNSTPIVKIIVENKELVPIYFSFKSELNKIKIPVPLLELLKNPTYKESFKSMLQPPLTPE